MAKRGIGAFFQSIYALQYPQADRGSYRLPLLPLRRSIASKQKMSNGNAPGFIEWIIGRLRYITDCVCSLPLCRGCVPPVPRSFFLLVRAMNQILYQECRTLLSICSLKAQKAIQRPA